MKNLRKLVSCLLVVLILFLLTLPSIGVSASTKINEGNYVVISNESVNPSDKQSTGTFNFNKVSSNININKNLDLSAYRIDAVMPVKAKINNSKQLKKNTKLGIKNYKEGDIRKFWVQNLQTNQYSQIDAKLLYTGSKAYVWVHNNEISKEDAAKLGEEFDKKIHPIVVNNFGQESDVDNDGHINILCFDIQDGFNGSGGYIAGYFDGTDLYKEELLIEGAHSNESEIFYIDTYPTMGKVKNAPRDVTQAYSTLAHEFQHMVNFNENYIKEKNKQMDTWLDEALSMAAEHIYLGEALNDRIDYYNKSNSIQDGHSLLYWGENGNELSNYALSYLFGQYIRVQAGQGNSIFKEIIQHKYNDYRAVEAIIQKYIDPKLTFGQMMTNFRIALLLNNSKGLYGFKGESGFEKIEPRFYTGGQTALAGGGAIVKEINSNNFTVPSNKGKNITYTLVQIHKLDLKVNGVSDLDKVVKGTTKPGATVYVKKGSTTYSGKADKNGDFAVTIPQQPAGTELTVYSEDNFGNESDRLSITVVDKAPPAKPTVNAVGDNATQVTGKTEPNSKIYLTIGSQIIEGQADKNGIFSISIPKQKAGTTLTIYAQDAAGNKSKEVKVTVLDKTAPAKPTVNPVPDNATKVTGKAEAESTVYVKAGTKQIGKGTADTKGNYSVTIPKQKAGTVLTVYAVDKAGNIGAETKVTVVDKTPPAQPKVNPVGDNVNKISGTAEAGATIYVKVGSKQIGKGTVNAKGAYTVTISSKQKADTTLTIYAVDKAGNKSKEVKIKVVDKTPPTAPTVNKVTSKTKKVTGKAEKNATIYIYKGSKLIGKGIVSSKGTYSVNISAQKKGTTLKVYAIDKAKNRSTPRTVKVK